MGLGAVLAVALLGAWGAARELAPELCAARFEVSPDKIIRTEESREMGARYLLEADVGARSECRALCCETERCDVFVYEEQSPNSCYLFECGPPEDFRCKFTAHGNFSAGVLALSRALAERQGRPRAPPPPAPPPAAPAPPPPPRAPPGTPPLPAREYAAAAPAAAAGRAPGTLTAAPPAGSGRCSRYEFECHGGGECIAVYNACDGVPQCADGSDEAPELACPAPPAPPPAAPAPAPTPAPAPAPAPAAPRPPSPAVLLQESEEAARAGWASGGAGGAGRWPQRLAQAARYAEGGAAAPPEPPRYAPRAPAPPPPAWPPQGWPHRAGPDEEWGGAWGGAGRAWPLAPRPPPPEPYLEPPPQPELALVYAGPAHTLRDAPKKGLGLQRPAPAAPAAAPAAPPAMPELGAAPAPPAPAPTPPRAPPPPPPPPPRHVENTTVKKDKASSAAAAARLAGAAGAAGGEWGADEHGGLSERPPAAVMLLVLGLAMSVALVALGALRARARRSMRRARAPFAHDADYLVNGMYL